MTCAIRFDRVSKYYPPSLERAFLARELVRLLLRKPRGGKAHWALSEVTFEVAPGEAVGVVGVNGSGKSTLLSLVARTSYPTGGRVEVGGRVGPLLELGAGFSLDLTGRENVLLNASLLGLSRQEAKERLPGILDYADLGEFVDAPLHTYSSGMVARLGFAVVAHIDADVLLVDETLSVGDGRFQAKCKATIQRFLSEGRTMLLVSHDLNTIESTCARVLWIDRGRLRADGPREQVLGRYRSFLTGDDGP